MAVMVSRLNYTNLATQLSTVGRKVLLSPEKSLLSSLCSSRSISSKATRDPDVKRPPPFPYKEKSYTLFHRLFDRTPDRLDENSKIIVVDGAIAAGKSAFAKELADELDMLYLPEATMDMVYINSYGYDMRQLDPKLPKAIRSFDTRNFCLDPHHENVAYLQVMLYRLKFSVYIDALAHLFNTGQGVVVDKSCYSDFVFAEALVREGFISKSAKYVYNEIIKHTLDELMRPHLAIYLDVPVEKVLQKIKERGRPHEQNSKALTPSFLTNVEDVYKRQYLKNVSTHSELLIYDWSDGGDVEVVVEDIERLDIDSYTVYDEKMKDWRLKYLDEWNDARKKYTDHKEFLMKLFNVPRLDCPELLLSGEDLEKFYEVWHSAPGMEYAEGYNAAYGDKNIWAKIKSKQKYSFFI